MAASSGRLLRIKKGSTAVVGAKTDNMSINNEMIDITDKDDVGWRTLLAEVGVRSVSADIAGILLDDTLLVDVVGAGSGLLTAWTIDVAVADSDLGSFSGNFFLSNISLTGEQEDAITFTATIESSGAITFTPTA